MINKEIKSENVKISSLFSFNHKSKSYIICAKQCISKKIWTIEICDIEYEKWRIIYHTNIKDNIKTLPTIYVDDNEYVMTYFGREKEDLLLKNILYKSNSFKKDKLLNNLSFLNFEYSVNTRIGAENKKWLVFREAYSENNIITSNIYFLNKKNNTIDYVEHERIDKIKQIVTVFDEDDCFLITSVRNGEMITFMLDIKNEERYLVSVGIENITKCSFCGNTLVYTTDKDELSGRINLTDDYSLIGI